MNFQKTCSGCFYFIFIFIIIVIIIIIIIIFSFFLKFWLQMKTSDF